MNVDPAKLEAFMGKVFENAGFTRFRRAAQTQMNLIIEAPTSRE
jgi:hypothetical protein